jgi:polyhydroxyalkanoate synthase subunit PhaC
MHADGRHHPGGDVPAELADAIDGGEAGGPIGWAKVGRSALKTARGGRSAALRRTRRFGAEAARIVAGSSTISPDRSDARFRDAAWRDHPLYRRTMRLYLAWCEQLHGVVSDAGVDPRDEERARFLVTLMTSALAPTNALAGNPAALKRAFETGGVSVLRGMRNYVDDVRSNGGLPRQADSRPFVVGGNVAATPGAVVYRDEVFELLHYAPATAKVRSRPVLMVPPQINKYYFMDLAPDRSFVEHAVARGISFFTISWRGIGPAQRDWDLDTYAAAVLRAVDAVREITSSDDVNLLGLCAGGILTGAVVAHLAQSSDTRVHTASFGVTLLDFDVQAPVNVFDSAGLLSLARLRTHRRGVMDARSMSTAFTLLRPDDLIWRYWTNNYLLGEDPPAFDILAWNADATNLPLALHRQFLDLFEHNRLASPGAMSVLGAPVDLAGVEMETYVTGATSDHLTPWKGCYRTTQLMSGPSTFVLSNAGHIASLINPPGNPKAHYFAGPEPGLDPDAWRAAAERHTGTWWEHWCQWILARSGEERPAPSRLGSRSHPPLEPAPGRYVRGLEAAPA